MDLLIHIKHNLLISNNLDQIWFWKKIPTTSSQGCIYNGCKVAMATPWKGLQLTGWKDDKEQKNPINCNKSLHFGAMWNILILRYLMCLLDCHSNNTYPHFIQVNGLPQVVKFPHSIKQPLHLIDVMSQSVQHSSECDIGWMVCLYLISPRTKSDHHFSDDLFTCIFVNEKYCILIQISLKFVSKHMIYNPAFIQIMADSE